ncbi:MAG TPA: acetate/propionate family kinase [Sphingomicrobium sp.]|nr:acetate/propionate family kinase [Sphingomicrobium sp.]
MQPLAVFNAGSSSIKFAVFEENSEYPILFRGQVEKLGVAPRLVVKNSSGEKLIEKSWSAKELDHGSATKTILETAVSLLGGERVRAVGHRVVHGGTRFTSPVLVNADILPELRKLCPLAPLHQPHNLAAIEAIAEAAPHLPQVACFDTAFHRQQPEIAQMFALPKEIADLGIRRYGFHGLSYEFIAMRLHEVAPALAEGRIVVAHLGNGSSLCAMRGGRSVATTMGFTAVDGLMMGTRCGSIDPGVLIYLVDELGMDARALEDLIYKRCGLIGVSGISSDMQTLRGSKEDRAAVAIKLFVYRIVREIGSMVAAAGGIDAIVFTGGIGQNDAQTRAEIALGCDWMGLKLSNDQNMAAATRIDSEDSAVAAFVIATDEEQMIARHTRALFASAPVRA